MTYRITNYSQQQARRLGVVIKPSSNKRKKIDIFKNGVKVASVGEEGAMDYPTWIETRGVAYANARRRSYKARHQHTRLKVGSASWYADNILW
jgi:hypothetical protein